MEHPKKFPRYDDVRHIDSNAITPPPDLPQNGAPRVDPAATAYTEMYCKGAIE
ncbi:hypothetical protein [Butyricicoccus sp. Marseille-Q5471]|uniref:hypothetical protein n=1 Tax=Butyricicoccus sp. Marseille-Q5471 TaxID=3039493 RepID=UPI0024BD5063|nr:hypothetical protein [Butyricicoccus sp. Marseille-Q5471]